jgi:ferrochelatase
MKSGILLLNLGGPETLADVRPFLYKLFSDPDIIRIKNPAFRRLLAWIISRAREKKSQNLYRQIGGGSPLRKITESQAAALETALAAEGTPARVYVGMLCGKPSIDEAFDDITADGARRLTLLPLFPQYSGTTTGACFRQIRTLVRRRKLSDKIEISFIEDWYKNPLYIDAIAETITAGFERFPEKERQDVHILYSAHSLPERYIGEGDPYLGRIRECVSLINDRLNEKFNADVIAKPSGFAGNAGFHPHYSGKGGQDSRVPVSFAITSDAAGYSLAFQSKVGPVKWLEPSVESVLKALARRGVRRVLAVPVSFVSDHIETLYELDIEYRNLAAELGITEFQRAESLNVHPKFIAALANICSRTE